MGRFVDLPDEQLLALTPRHPDAFGTFYERHVRLVMGYLVRATGDAEQALDLTAEVFAAALVAAKRFKEGPPATAWLVGIARNKVAAARRRDRTRRRRRLALLAAVPVLLVAGTAGAAAVGDFSTGVPAIDGLLANEDGSGPLGSDVRPGPGGASEPLSVPNGPGGRDAAAVAYLSRDGLVCKARGDFRRWDGSPRGSYGGCLAPANLARMLSRRTVYCCVSEHGPERRIYDGFAAGDVVALRLLMEDGATVEAKLTPPWAPDAPGAEPLRLFVAVDERDIDVGGDGVQLDEGDLIMRFPHRAEADLSDGRTVDVRLP